MTETARFPSTPRARSDDDDVLLGFAPPCGACWGTTQPRHTGAAEWWECGQCGLPRIG